MAIRTTIAAKIAPGNLRSEVMGRLYMTDKCQELSMLYDATVLGASNMYNVLAERPGR